ncbi:hypothetical protein LHA01_28510 [Schleiferilactobacillus harbinensis]|nr:hypothetical protein LHA01_28510 [Schleiferilactobacillus harbinensis]
MDQHRILGIKSYFIKFCSCVLEVWSTSITGLVQFLAGNYFFRKRAKKYRVGKLDTDFYDDNDD